MQIDTPAADLKGIWRGITVKGVKLMMRVQGVTTDDGVWGVLTFHQGVGVWDYCSPVGEVTTQVFPICVWAGPMRWEIRDL